VTNKDDPHGHEHTEIELNQYEGGWDTYKHILILGILHSGQEQRVNIGQENTGSESEHYQYDARDSKHSAE